MLESEIGGIMMTLYEKYKKLQLNGSMISLEESDSMDEYFCTPKDVKIIGWEGVDGIHYCFIKGYDDMVFAVNPMAPTSQYVYPLAASFEEFLGLILACGSTTPIEQIYNWNETQFDTYIKEIFTSVDQEAVLDRIRNELGVAAIENPFHYVKKLQDSFDYSKICYKDEYYNLVNPIVKERPEWKVYFDGNFWSSHTNREDPGKEIPVNQNFVWEDENWSIPAIYVCSEGLVMDLCVEVPTKKIQLFMEKWLNTEQRDEISLELLEERDVENPFSFDIRPSVTLNGEKLLWKQSSSIVWNPCLLEGYDNNIESDLIREHYNCDKDSGWCFIRCSFHWITKNEPVIRSLSITLEQELRRIPGPHFTVEEAGQKICCVHPITKKEHILTVIECSKERLPETHFSNEEYEFPCHYEYMTYTIEPDLTDRLIIQDCSGGDSPIRRALDLNKPSHSGIVAVGIIGCADGPTAIFIGKNQSTQTNLHVASSSLYFKPMQQQIEWRISFQVKLREPITVELLM